MTKKQALRRWRKACERWVSRLGLSDYTRTYEILVEAPLEHQNSNRPGSWVAKCETNTRYKWLKAAALLEYTAEVDDDGLDETACHEIVHAVLDPIDAVTCEVIDALPEGARQGFDAYRAATLERTTTHIEHVLRLLDKN